VFCFDEIVEKHVFEKKETYSFSYQLSAM